MPLVAPAPPFTQGEGEQRRGERLRGQLGIAAAWFVISYMVSMLAWVFVPALLMGWKPMVILSGSMAPTIVPGDVVLIDPSSTNRAPGAVLAFTLDQEVIVMHRVAGEPEAGVYTTKGDANREVDSTPVPEAAVLGQGRLLVPFVGYAKLWLKDAAAVVVAAAVGLLLLLVRKRGARLVVAGGFLVGWLAFSATSAFADLTSNTGSSFGSGTVLPPTNLTGSCTGGVGVGNPVPVDLTWTSSPTVGVTEYRILYDAPPAVGGYSQIGVVSAPQTNFTHTIPVAELALGQPHTYVVRAVLGPWESADSNVETVTVTVVVLVYVCS